MFCLSLVDHLRLNFGHVVQNYASHARASERQAAIALRARIAVLALTGVATSLMVVSLFQPARGFQIAAAVVGGVAVIAHAAYLAFGLEARVFAHRSCAHRLWLM